MQCQACSPQSGPRQRAGPVPVPSSRPVEGTHAVTRGGWRALPAGRPRSAHTDDPNPGSTALLQPSTRAGFYPKPRSEGWHRWHCQGDAAAGAGSTYFFIIIIFLLLAARTAPGRCCHQAKAPLSWRLYGLRRAGGTVARGWHGRDTGWKPKCDTQARGETKQRDSNSTGVKGAGSPAHPGLQHRNFLLILDAEEQEAVWITSGVIQVFSPHKNRFGISRGYGGT